MGSQIPTASSVSTSGKLPRNFTCRAYAAGPLIAVAFEIRMCSIRKAPTGIIPVSECNRRQKNEWPAPGRSGATPAGTLPAAAAGAVVKAMKTISPEI